MKSRLLVLCLSVFVIVPLLAACGGDEKADESALLHLLRFVPDTAENRQYLTYGDADAWHTSWDVPRVDNMEQLEQLSREANALWLFNLPRQTTSPDSLGFQFMLKDDLRAAYGFDAFNLDRYLLAGSPPDWLTVAEFSFEEEQIADALTASGYEVETLDEGRALYSIRGDYEMDLRDPIQAGKLGNLNRIALLDGHMVVGKAMAIVINALEAYDGESSSLADSPAYIAASRALEDPALEDTGELVGVILMEGAQFYGLESLIGSGLNAEQVEALREKLTSQGPRLSPYQLVAFATRHGEGATYLILAVVFAEGADAGAAADTLASRLRGYESLARRRPLDDLWTFDRAQGVEAEGLPVALVVMRVDDPSLAKDERIAAAAVFSWIQLVLQRDTAFLATE